MSADRVDRDSQEAPLDALWRLGLEELVGKAEAPDRVWGALRGQVGAGPSRPVSPSRKASTAWGALNQFVALAAVFLLLLGVRAELVQQGGAEALFWQGRFPTPWAWRAPSQPLYVGLGDTLSSHVIHALAREQRALASLRYPSQDPFLRYQGTGVSLIAKESAVLAAAVPQPSDEGGAVLREEALRALREPAQDPLLARRAW